MSDKILGTLLLTIAWLGCLCLGVEVLTHIIVEDGSMFGGLILIPLIWIMTNCIGNIYDLWE